MVECTLQTILVGRVHGLADTTALPDTVSANDAWTALYTTLRPETSLGEVLRHTPPVLMERLNTLRLTELHVGLTRVLDIRNLQKVDSIRASMFDDVDYSLSQRLAWVAISAGAEAIIVPSATLLGDNMVIFPDNMKPESRLEVIGSRDPVLYVERE